jgi:hypothetical protein
MPAVAVRITRFVDDHFPGFVECELVDAAGVSHIFVEKVPVVTTEELSSSSCYPCAGLIACQVLAQWADADGVWHSRIDTSKPCGVESSAGVTEFVVASSQIVGSCDDV